MTISSETRRAGPFVGNGVATSFPFGFKVFAKTDLTVLTAGVDGSSSAVLTLDSDYSVALNADQKANPGGTITFPISGSPMTAANVLAVIGGLLNVQPTDITNTGGFFPNVLEDMGDRSTIQIQQLAEALGRALTFPATDDVSTLTTSTPSASARSNMVLGFDGNGNPTLFTPGAASTLPSTNVTTPDLTLAALLLGGLNRVVDSIASLRALKRAVYTRAFATGYYTPHDGGGGAYQYDPADTSSADNGGTIIVAADGGRWKLQLTGPVSVCQFGAKGDGVTDNTAVFTAALATGLTVFVPGGTFCVSSITVSAGNQALYGVEGSIIQGLNTPDGTPIITLAGDFSNLNNIRVFGTNNKSPNIRTTGFRNKVENIFSSGFGTGFACLNCLQINGRETIVLFGDYKGASDPTGAGGANGAGIVITQPDAWLADVYIESNRHGLFASGIGSITAFHVHSFNNSLDGFFLAGAGSCQLHACYADTNGHNGFEISDLVTGLDLIDCWGFKSSNAADGFQDFAFFNARQVKVIGGRSSGAGAFGKAFSYKVDTLSDVSFIGCDADIAPSAVSGNAQFVECAGALAKYNRPTDVVQTGFVTIANAGNANLTTDTKFDGSTSSPGLQAFEVTLLYRNSSGSNNGVEKKVIIIGVGGQATQVVNTFPTTQALTVSAPTFTQNTSTNNLWSLTFNVANGLGFSAQLAAHIRYLGSGRGFI